MMEINSIKDIDTNSIEGRLLIATLSRLSCQKEYDTKTPDEILGEMIEVAADIFQKD